MTTKELLEKLKSETQLRDAWAMDTMIFSEKGSPIFLEAKGRHNAYLSILKTIEHYERIIS